MRHFERSLLLWWASILLLARVVTNEFKQWRSASLCIVYHYGCGNALRLLIFGSCVSAKLAKEFESTTYVLSMHSRVSSKMGAREWWNQTFVPDQHAYPKTLCKAPALFNDGPLILFGSGDDSSNLITNAFARLHSHSKYWVTNVTISQSETNQVKKWETVPKI